MRMKERVPRWNGGCPMLRYVNEGCLLLWCIGGCQWSWGALCRGEGGINGVRCPLPWCIGGLDGVGVPSTMGFWVGMLDSKLVQGRKLKAVARLLAWK